MQPVLESFDEFSFHVLEMAVPFAEVEDFVRCIVGVTLRWLPDAAVVWKDIEVEASGDLAGRVDLELAVSVTCF